MPSVTVTKTAKVETVLGFEPEIFFEHNGVKIYHVYSENAKHRLEIGWPKWDVLQCKAKTIFTTNNECDFYYTWSINFDDNHRGIFGAWSIPNPNNHDLKTHDGIKALLREAIEFGWIRQNEKPMTNREWERAA